MAMSPTPSAKARAVWKVLEHRSDGLIHVTIDRGDLARRRFEKTSASMAYT